MNRQGEKVINLGIGSPDLPPSSEVIEELYQAASTDGNHGYQSYKGHIVLREAIAAWYKRYYGVQLDPEREILPLIGSKEGIVHLCMTYLQSGDEALIPNPGYPTYASAVRLSGAKAVPYLLSEESGWLPDLDQLAKQDLSRVKMMWINYPHMPTGASAPDSFFEELIEFARKQEILLCHDNPYSFILNNSPKSLMAIDGAMEVAVELNSLSKSSNMAGWRIGMMVGNEDRIQEVLRFKSNMDSGMFLPLQLAAAKALSLEKEWYDDINQEYQKRKELACKLMDQLGCVYEKDQSGMFVWARIPEHEESGFSLCDKVLEQARVFVTPGGIFGSAGDPYVRISLCAKETTFEQAMERLEKAGW